MRMVTVAGFVVCAIAIVALVVQSRRTPERLAPFASLLDVVMADRAARFTILLFWWWLGWHFLVTPPVP
jgi:Mn2+/Fe2+ NRAMP family transporter